MAPARAVKNVEAWEEHLEELEIVGAKTLRSDPGILKRVRQKDPIDSMAMAR